jgi:2-polyprenyl-6-methoxyphenol hydroxylase-like FAD-dependent oxidoreductase
VVGADGAHSMVRSAMGLDFPGETYQQQFLLADIALTGRPCADNEAVICTSPRGWWWWAACPTAPTASSPPCRPARGSPSTPTGPRSGGC